MALKIQTACAAVSVWFLTVVNGLAGASSTRPGGPTGLWQGSCKNEVYIFMVNHAAPRENGHSMVFDFNGKIAKEMDQEERVFVYDLDLDALNRHREKGIYAFHHRRPELYRILSDPAGQVHPPEANLPPAP